MDLLIVSLLTAWYMLAGFGLGKLLKHNKQGISKDIPIIASVILWPMFLVLVSLCKETED